MTKFKVTIRTPQKNKAGTNAKVSMAIYGTNGKNHTFRNLSDPNDNDPFEGGDENVFNLNASEDINDIEKIDVWHDNTGKNPEWYLGTISIENLTYNKSWEFEANKMLNNSNGCKTTLHPKYKYKITFYTGDVDKGGTSAQVTLTIHGTKHSGPAISFSKEQKRGRVLTLEHLFTDFGELNKITVKHNNKNDNPGWFLDGVKIKCVNTNKTWHFPLYKWLAKDEDDGKIERVINAGKAMAHYDYNGNHPNDRKNSLSRQIQGVCHDTLNNKKFWFFTQNGNIWKIPVTQNLQSVSSSATDVIKKTTGDHLGDLDCYNHYLFIPVEKNGKAYIDVYNASNLSKKASQQISKTIYKTNTTQQMSHCAWAAINPNNGLLFTSDQNLNNNNPILVYKIDLNKVQSGNSNFLTPFANLYVKDQEGKNYPNKVWIQGGCFDNDNHLHIVNGKPNLPIGHVAIAGWEHSATGKNGIIVLDIPNLSQGNYPAVNIRTNSNQTHDFRFEFTGLGDEPEGITYFNLSSNEAPNIAGQLHAIVLKNDVGESTADDCWYFKHYKKI